MVSLESLFRAGALTGLIARWLLRRRWRLATRNLERAFPEMCPTEIRAIAREHFRLLGANLFCCAKLTAMPPSDIASRIKIENSVAIPQPEQRRGWVAMVSHLGNWELFSHLTDLLPEYRCGAIYHPLANRFIDAHLARLRARSGMALFARRSGYVRCLDFLREGGALGVLVDQFAGSAGLWTPFFNRLTSTSQLAATLAVRVGVEIMPMAIYTEGCARWRIVTGQPFGAGADDPDALTARMNRELEALIRRAPADWLWSHDRWKTPRPRFLLARDWKRYAGLDENLAPFRILVRAPDDPAEAEACLPALRAIKRGRPDAWVAVAANADLGAVFTEADAFVPLRGSVFENARAIRTAHRFDAAVIFPKSWRAAFEVFLARVPCRAGHPGRPLLNYWEMEPGESEPPDRGADRYLRIADVLGAWLS